MGAQKKIKSFKEKIQWHYHDFGLGDVQNKTRNHSTEKKMHVINESEAAFL
jgi:hypothetical protein